MASSIEAARAAFARQDWPEAFAAFSAAAGDRTLTGADRERQAVSAYLIGEDEASDAAREAAFRAAQGSGQAAEAARHAFWLALCLMLRGQPAHAGGWFRRTERILEEEATECAARGYVLVPRLLHALDSGDPGAARDLARRVVQAGEQFDDEDLRALGRVGLGQALIALGQTTAGFAQLDEAMLAAAAGEVGPITTGIAYCATILQCMASFDFPRAAEWTQVLSAWCDAQPGLVPFRGQCLVHRSQLAQARGDWPQAMAVIEAALTRLTDPPHPALGMAHYQKAELHRLCGAYPEADAAYVSASRHGQDPMPGLALLQLGRGDVDSASAAVARALDGTRTPTHRAPLLAAAVDIRREGRDRDGAEAAADELTSIAAGVGSQVLLAMAAQARGAVLIAQGDHSAALGELRLAATTWATLPLPYEAARTAVLFGLACSMRGDQTSAALEFAHARETFAELGARPDLDRLDRLTQARTAAPPPGGTLSAREREVLQHVAAGATNREVAKALVISEHTVSRHLENIFRKLGVTSRAAATARAYEQRLL